MTAAQTTKAKLNLSAVTPQPPPPEDTKFDTTTPIDVSIIPFTQKDIGKWGPWLLARMAFIWPSFTNMNFQGLLLSHANTNSTLFIRSKFAILLAVVTRDTFDPRPVVDLVFLFKHHPADDAEDKFVRILFRHMEDWARSKGAGEIRVLHPDRCDMTFSRTKETLWGEEQKILVKAITK